MNKIYIALFLIFALLICLPACEQKIEENPEFEILESLCNNDYSSYSISIVIESSKGTLTENYAVAVNEGDYTVNYRVERFSEFTANQDGISVPNNYITVNEGTLTGEEAASYKLPTFKFSYSCLESEKIIGRTFKANITSLEKFMGKALDEQEASVVVEYTASSVKTIEITYTTQNNTSVQITYTFN